MLPKIGLLLLWLTGVQFASRAEMGLALLLLPPLVFFGFCALALWRLLLCAFAERHRVTRLHPPGSQQRASIQAIQGEPDGKASQSIETIGRPQAPLETNDETIDREAALPSLAGTSERVRFLLLIPAHDEELLLGAALDGLNALNYPREAWRAVVIADNCSDRTASIAREHGAIVLERADTVHVGKGYALEWALQRLLCATQTETSALGACQDFDAREFDAVVILDADTLVAPNLLTAFASGLRAGQGALQARYEVLNAGDSWRTRLMACALALTHVVKPLGRERLQLSDGLKGNGMCFARAVVERIPWSGASITEDIEYTLRLCRAGIRVAFLPETAVWAQMPTTGAQASSQRKRWEGGRYRLLFTVAPRLWLEGVRSRRRLLTDRAMELIIPPFAEMFAGPVLLLSACVLIGHVAHWPVIGALAWVWLAILALQAGYLFFGLWVARVPSTLALSALYAPIYIVWKFGIYALMAIGRSAGGWKRTERREL